MKRIVLTVSLLVALTVFSATSAFPPGATSADSLSPTARVEAIVKMWRTNLRSEALVDPRRHFLNPSKASLASRLRRAAIRYRLTVVKAEIFHPRQGAPLVVIQAKDKHELAASAGAVLHLIDPKARTGDDRTGWAYEGFLFEARDRHGVPFLVTYNWWRGPHSGGGQWAADPSLYPFPHG